jgi:transposase IS116/IS110/IS902 family protein
LKKHSNSAKKSFTLLTENAPRKMPQVQPLGPGTRAHQQLCLGVNQYELRRRNALWKLTVLWKNQRTVFPPHPGVGALTALAFVLIIGRAERFQCGKQIACYLGLVPLEDSSGERRRLGHITKQGNALLRFLLVEAAQVTVRTIPQWRSKYFHLAMRRGRKIAKVAMARKLAVRLFWMMRQEWNYEQAQKFGSQGRKLSFHTVVTKGSTR